MVDLLGSIGAACSDFSEMAENMVSDLSGLLLGIAQLLEEKNNKKNL